MTEISFEDLRDRLTPEATQLLIEMAAAHVESTGDRMFIRSDSASGTHMIFTGEGSTRRFDKFDGGAVEDLCGWGLLHLGFSTRGTPNYRVTGEALRFYRWLMAERGSAIEQVEAAVRQVTDGAGFAAASPGASHHLKEAFDLLWGGRTDDQIVSEIGDHLRKALMDATTAIVGAAGGAEKPVQRLKDHLAKLTIPEREREVLAQVIELARVVLRLDHRLNHIRDEADQGEAPATWEEARRAAFATALACYELDRLRAR